jgi:hypothetical protein
MAKAIAETRRPTNPSGGSSAGRIATSAARLARLNASFDRISST